MDRTKSNVPKLSEFAKRQCIRFAHRKSFLSTFNIMSTTNSEITDVGDIRYELIKPILKRMAPKQLAQIEDKSPHIKSKSGELWRDHIKTDFHDRPLPPPSEPLTNYRKLYGKYYKQKQRMLNEASARLRESTQRFQKEKASRTISTLEVDPRATQIAIRKKASSSSTPSGSRLINKAWATAKAKGPVFSQKNTRFVNSANPTKRQRTS